MTEGFVRFDEEWDAGDLGCGELVLELKMRLDRMPAGRVVRLIARDAGAPADLPAWCRLTGHTLLREQHPVYLIQRKHPSGGQGPQPTGAAAPAEARKENRSWPISSA